MFSLAAWNLFLNLRGRIKAKLHPSQQKQHFLFPAWAGKRQTTQRSASSIGMCVGTTGFRIFVFYLFVFYFEIGSHFAALAGLELSMQIRQMLNTQRSTCFCLQVLRLMSCIWCQAWPSFKVLEAVSQETSFDFLVFKNHITHLFPLFYKIKNKSVFS